MNMQLFDDMAQCSDAEVRRLLLVVCPQRREKALRFKFLQGQYACLKAYEMLTLGVQQILSQNPSENLNQLSAWNGNFVYNEHGKPFFQNKSDGQRIPNVDFNLSHCKNGIAVAINDQPVGVDIESFHNIDSPLIKRTMNEAEIQQINASNNPAKVFTQLWTQKEAVLKLLGTGLIDNLHDVLNDCQHKYQIETMVDEQKQYACSVATYLTDK